MKSMAKRRASEDALLCTSPSKKCRGLCGVDMRLESVAASGGVSHGVSPPSLHALLGSRCRKRPLYFDETEATDFDLELFRKSTHDDLQVKHPAYPNHQINTVHPQQTSGNFQEPRNFTNAKSTNKRTREDCDEPADTVNSKAVVDRKTDIEDNFNSFQFWRIPLPELDMSLLQEPNKDFSSEEMET
ncbi:uncharacterized protein wu:fa19b12 [Boleophthalmus pectinirostris]|uniref:uncharacterized protein wu:fa19b12 n=1 Tax=Boleophthalmus pectinirostris TaxID=150288 RepID=UPI002431658A|nr:uncharacterized protein wu:fa19b12 [Boleophthalmus pectinirostris]XP_055017709.1 uncharacterized protein wu:fa19b12 [Boleophthalmus pectinirostris]